MHTNKILCALLVLIEYVPFASYPTKENTTNMHFWNAEQIKENASVKCHFSRL